MGGADEQTVCDCGWGVDLLAFRHVVPLSRSRSFAIAAAPMSSPSDVIAAVPSVACFVVIRAAHRVDTVPALSSRFGFCPHPCQSLASAHRLPPACLLRHRPSRPSSLRVMSSPPLAPPSLSRNGEGLRDDCGCWLFGCHRLAYLPNAVATPRAIWSVPISPRHLVRSCVLLPRMCRRRGAGDAVRPLRLLSRWSVLIMFKMLPYQSFKTLRLFGMALLCGYRGGGVRSIASPPHLGFISSVSG